MCAPGALCFAQRKLCITPPCTQQRQHPSTVKFHRERAFINSSHSSTGLPTEDLARACWNAISASQTGERSFARCQTRGTKGSAQIRHLHTKHKGVVSHKGTDEARFFGAGTEREAGGGQRTGPGREFSDLWSTRQRAVGFFSIPPFAESVSETNIDAT